MFELKDVLTLLWSLCIVLPIASFVHQLGHTVMALVFGGKGTFTIGRGKTLFSFKNLTVKRLYFLDSFCQYEGLRYDNRATHALVYGGGALFNLLSILLVNFLIVQGVVEPHLFFYQFAYFSSYYVIFALLPVRYSDDHPSDGMAIYEVLRHGRKCDPID
ncbi:hypothetical protein [Metabacillus sp. 84]|uniref:hypothetical protein n=1 Tax=unclassified Metabacillus TaxID=2675274 RepID=UPI003CEED638